MKKFLCFLMVISILATTIILSGCAKGTGGPGGVSSASLAQMKKAASDAGYPVTDNYVGLFMEDVTAGFTVEIEDSEQDVVYSVLECKTEEAAIKNAKTIDEAGYNIAVRNGKILTCYGVDDKDWAGKDVLIAIVTGKTVPKKS